MRAVLPLLVLSCPALLGCGHPAPPSMAETIRCLRSRPMVDLTHAFHPGIPHWPGFDDERRQIVYSHDKEGGGTRGSGFLAEVYCHVGQWGTHVDPPLHFVKGLRSVDQIEPREMLLPLVVIDIHDRVARNPDTVVTVEDVTRWEQRHGPLPGGAFVALRTDWSRRWPDASKMRNADAGGVAHYPGWSLEVLRLLYEQRGVTATGHETTDTDPGSATSRGDYSAERYVLSSNHYQIELLASLDRVPEAGALAVVSFPKPLRGSGFPARVLAVLP